MFHGQGRAPRFRVSPKDTERAPFETSYRAQYRSLVRARKIQPDIRMHLFLRARARALYRLSTRQMCVELPIRVAPRDHARRSSRAEFLYFFNCLLLRGEGAG